MYQSRDNRKNIDLSTVKKINSLFMVLFAVEKPDHKPTAVCKVDTYTPLEEFGLELCFKQLY